MKCALSFILMKRPEAVNMDKSLMKMHLVHYWPFLFFNFYKAMFKFTGTFIFNSPELHESVFLSGLVYAEAVVKWLRLMP